ncbi:MAG: hypothetical protein WC718_00390 [Phycisphaerales bacterium]|jgi:hypothetical protein
MKPPPQPTPGLLHRHGTDVAYEWPVDKAPPRRPAPPVSLRNVQQSGKTTPPGMIWFPVAGVMVSTTIEESNTTK